MGLNVWLGYAGCKPCALAIGGTTMTDLTKPIKRKTPETRYEKSQHRNIIVSVEPAGRDSAVIGFRLAGTRQTYRIGVQQGYNEAVQRHISKIAKKAKELHKDEKLPMRTARARARKELYKELA